MRRCFMLSTVLLLLTVLSSPVSARPWRLHFTEGQDTFSFDGRMNQALVAFVLSATTSVEVTAYQLADRNPIGNSLADALIDRHLALGAGSVRVVVDTDSLAKAAVQDLIAAGIVVHDDLGSLDEMHDKFVVVDGSRVFTATANFTEPGLSAQDNVAIELDDPSIAGAYLAEFEEMWAGIFKAASPPTPNTEFMLDGVPLRLLFGADDDPIGSTTLGVRAFVQSATESIHFGIYTFSGTVGDFWAGLEDDLVVADASGVRVRGIFDGGQNLGRKPYQVSGGSGPQFDELALDVRTDAHASLLHAKVMVVDQAVLLVGSPNYTYSADAYNDENLVIFQSSAAARRVVKYLNWLHGLAIDDGTPANPAPDLTSPLAATGVALVDAPGPGAVQVSWSTSGDPALARTHVFLQTTPIVQADLDFRTGIDPATTLSRAGTSVVLSILGDGSPVVDGIPVYAAVTFTDLSGNESLLGAGSVAGPLTPVGGADTTAPIFAGLTSLTGTGATTLRARWSAATDDTDPQALLRYRLYLATGAGAENFAVIEQQSAPGATSMTLAGLVPSTGYFAVVRVIDTAGNEDANTVERAAATCAALDLCNGVDDDCNPATADGSGDPAVGLACDGPDADLCKEGTNACTGGVIVCGDVTGDTLDLCGGGDQDCNPATADGSGDPAVGLACDGPDADLCKEGTSACTGGVIVCGDVTGDTLDLCGGGDQDCNPATPDGSGDPAVGLACDGPDADLCKEGTKACTGGAILCGDTTGDSIEVLNGLDDDCDGLTDEGLTAPDGGAGDAGPADAAQGDAGPGDAGAGDGGLLDGGGVMDGGSSDAGSGDAALLDGGGAMDGGTGDAGRSDAALADANVPEAGGATGGAVGCGCSALAAPARSGTGSGLLGLLGLVLVSRRRRLPSRRPGGRTTR